MASRRAQVSGTDTPASDLEVDADYEELASFFDRFSAEDDGGAGATSRTTA